MKGRVKALEKEGKATRDDSKVPPPRIALRGADDYLDSWNNFDAWQATLALNEVTKPGSLMSEIDRVFTEAGCSRRVRSPYS